MVRNNIGRLIGICSIPFVRNLVPDVEIRGLWKTLIWEVENFLGNRIILKDDVLGILTQFMCFMTCTCYFKILTSCIVTSLNFIFDTYGVRVTCMQIL